ncbi:MAG: DNA translocase FtsK [Bacteroidales bacterium]|nr:DNA translocase FtsK [Bacteroidales bacterium]
MARKNNKIKPDKKIKGKNNKNINTKDERFRYILGLGFFSFSIFIFLAFFSYLFTWKIDQSKLDIDWLTLIQRADINVENWAGKTGALLAHRFIHDWFGIASFSLVFLFIILSVRLFNIRLLPLRKTIKYSIIYSVWISVAFGYFFGKLWFFLGGAYGYFISLWLNDFIGKTGTAFILMITLFSIIILSFDNAIENFKILFNKLILKIISKKSPDETIDKKNGIIINEQTDKKSDNDLIFEISKSNEAEDKIDNIVKSHEINLSDNIETVEVKEIKKEKNDTEADDKDNLNFTVENSTKNKDDQVNKISTKPIGNYDPTKDLSLYKLPHLDLLEKHELSNSMVTNEELVSNKNKIVETLGNYNIKIDRIKATIGPTITLYEIVPAPGVRISKIKNLEDDIALSLSALGIRIIAPIPGRGTIGIEVPNLKPEIVSMRSIISSKVFQDSKYELPIALGKTISNETFVIDLTKMPHLLVAGATGQGKSVGLNAILTSLLYKKHPSQLKFVMIDPKKVELTLYSKIEKYFLAKLPDAEEPIITDTQKVINTLNSLTIEMDERYDLLKKAHTRNIKEYNAKFIERKLNPENGHKFLPYIVLVIDEFADLILTAGKEIEMPLARLAQLARAIGIHLIIATQRPTTNIITGLIKANFPARISFRVTSSIDSRTILDTTGANQLIGRGDMLVSVGGNIIRIQCAFVDTPELDEITNYISSQQSYPEAFLLPEYVDEGSSSITEVDLTKRDELFEDAARLLVIHQQGSTSLIQRKFSIGYNRAGRIIDQLEAAGIVGPFEGSKARQVLMPDEYSLEQLLNRLNNNT